MKKFNIPFSPPDIGEEEIKEVVDTLKSGWITTGQKQKSLRKKLQNIVIQIKQFALILQQPLWKRLLDC